MVNTADFVDTKVSYIHISLWAFDTSQQVKSVIPSTHVSKIETTPAITWSSFGDHLLRDVMHIKNNGIEASQIPLHL